MSSSLMSLVRQGRPKRISSKKNIDFCQGEIPLEIKKAGNRQITLYDYALYLEVTRVQQNTYQNRTFGAL